MKKGMQELAGCSSIEDLSAFHDRALQDVQVEEHLVNCDACRASLEAFTVIDEAVQALGVPPSDLAGQISGNCASLAPEPLLFRASAFPFWRHVAAAAAIIVVAVAIHYAVSSSVPASSQVATTPPTAVPAPLPSAGAVKPLSEPPQLVASKPERPKENRIISAVELTRTNASGGTGPGAVPFAGALRKTLVPPRVKHVWVVGDVTEATALLHGSLPEGVSCTTTADEASKRSLQVLLTDEQLQSLVDRLAEAGWPLLSPGVPQPRKGSELILSQNVIRYDVDLVIHGRE